MSKKQNKKDGKNRPKPYFSDKMTNYRPKKGPKLVKKGPKLPKQESSKTQNYREMI